MIKQMHTPRGFIALMSVIIISAILLVVLIAGSTSGFIIRFNTLDAEAKQHSSALVDACADTILSRLATDSTYAGPEVVAVGSDSCQVVGTTNPGADPRTFEVQAIYSHSYTNALITVSVAGLSITSWQEVGSF